MALDYFQAIVLGIIQGITEWLPVSSKAMVAIFGKFVFGLEYREALGDALFLHSGTLVASIIYFRDDLTSIIKSIFDKNAKKNIAIFLIVSTICTGIIALPLLYITLNVDFPESYFTIAIGAFLLIITYMHKNRKGSELSEELDIKKAILVGAAQGLSAIPGFSRSGTTIGALLAQKVSLEDAFKLSFLMSIPIVFGVEVILPFIRHNYTISMPLIVGSIVAGIVSMFAIKKLLEIAAHRDFYKVIGTIAVLVIVAGLTLIFANA